jgi:hypothetical protein
VCDDRDIPQILHGRKDNGRINLKALRMKTLS